MRDVNRIPKFCNRLAELWAKEVPDWRFGQLVSNVLGYIYEKSGRDPWFFEEDLMMQYIEEYFKGDEQ